MTGEEYIKNFNKFNKKEIDSAVEELSSLREENRKHLQRLVYTNVVNRFDSLVDHLLMSHAVDTTSSLYEMVIHKVKDQPISQKEVYEILLSSDYRSASLERVEDLVREHFLRDRHSEKLQLLLTECYGAKSHELNAPRVNANNGKIHSKTTPRKSVKVPTSIIGYADYLYSKRNAMVHGDGTSSKILDRDYQFLKKYHINNPGKMVGVKLNSITSASTFYRYLAQYLMDGDWPPSRGF